MSRKTSKKRPKTTPKARKQAKAHHVNQYVARCRLICDKLGAGELFRGMEHPFRFLYNRVHMEAPWVVAADGHQIARRFLESIRQLTHGFMLLHTAPVPGTDLNVPLHDYFTTLPTLDTFCKFARNVRLPRAHDLTRALQPLHDAVTGTGARGALEEIVSLMTVVLWQFSRLDGALYALHPSKRHGTKGTDVIVLELRRIRPHTRHFTVDGVRRGACRIGWPGLGGIIDQPTVTPAMLGIDHPEPDRPLDIYVQPHALHRLRERLPHIRPYHTHRCLAASFDGPTVHHDHRTAPLVAYTLDNHTVGFLPVALVDNAVLIRTFLFVTQTTTPTGHALDRILTLTTRDKHYLNLHTLRAFITTDILDNPTLRAALRESGCGGVMEDFSRMLMPSGRDAREVGYAAEVGRCLAAARPLRAAAG